MKTKYSVVKFEDNVRNKTWYQIKVTYSIFNLKIMSYWSGDDYSGIYEFKSRSEALDQIKDWEKVITEELVFEYSNGKVDVKSPLETFTQ